MIIVWMHPQFAHFSINSVTEVTALFPGKLDLSWLVPIFCKKNTCLKNKHKESKTKTKSPNPKLLETLTLIWVGFLGVQFVVGGEWGGG